MVPSSLCGRIEGNFISFLSGPCGGHVGAFGQLLGAFWTSLGCLWESLAVPLGSLGISCGVLAVSWSPSWHLWEHLGVMGCGRAVFLCSLAALSFLPCISRASLGPFWVSLWCPWVPPGRVRGFPGRGSIRSDEIKGTRARVHGNLGGAVGMKRGCL